MHLMCSVLLCLTEIKKSQKMHQNCYAVHTFSHLLIQESLVIFQTHEDHQSVAVIIK
jgi:hypothetical protein